MGSSAADARIKLQAFNIFVESTAARPALLQTHIDKVIKAPRTSSSPADKRLHQVQPQAVDANESSAIDMLVDNLLFRNEVDGGERHVFRVREAYLERRYLPAAPTSFVAKTHGSLTQPRVDTALGYILRKDADAGCMAPAFSNAEEVVVR